jgi:hypothetical protein
VGGVEYARAPVSVGTAALMSENNAGQPGRMKFVYSVIDDRWRYERRTHCILFAGWLVGEDVRARACRLDGIRVLGNSTFRTTPQLFELVNRCRVSVKWLRFGTGSRTRTRK